MLFCVYAFLCVCFFVCVFVRMCVYVSSTAWDGWCMHQQTSESHPMSAGMTISGGSLVDGGLLW